MGFHEFDRIRAKNRLWDAADQEIERLKGQNLTNADIINVCSAQIETNPTDTRNEIYSTMIDIVRRLDEETNSRTNSSRS